MITLNQVTKRYPTRDGARTVIDRVDFTIARGDAVGICGPNGAGKSTLLRLIAGVETPTSGTIDRDVRVSWPIGYASAFQSSLSGADNVRFIARIYRRPVAPTVDFVADFAELGPFMREPVRTYSAGMVARLAFATSLAVDFDCYLVDEVITAGDARFRQRCHDALMERRDRGTLVMVSHDPDTLRAYCTSGAVIEDARLFPTTTIDEAIDRYMARLV